MFFLSQSFPRGATETPQEATSNSHEPRFKKNWNMKRLILRQKTHESLVQSGGPHLSIFHLSNHLLFFSGAGLNKPLSHEPREAGLIFG